jgi:hypothetical protein
MIIWRGRGSGFPPTARSSRLRKKSFDART